MDDRADDQCVRWPGYVLMVVDRVVGVVRVVSR
jgi:hypothetical protein